MCLDDPDKQGCKQGCFCRRRRRAPAASARSTPRTEILSPPVRGAGPGPQRDTGSASAQILSPPGPAPRVELTSMPPNTSNTMMTYPEAASRTPRTGTQQSSSLLLAGQPPRDQSEVSASLSPGRMQPVEYAIKTGADPGRPLGAARPAQTPRSEKSAARRPNPALPAEHPRRPGGSSAPALGSRPPADQAHDTTSGRAGRLSESRRSPARAPGSGLTAESRESPARASRTSRSPARASGSQPRTEHACRSEASAPGMVGSLTSSPQHERVGRLPAASSIQPRSEWVPSSEDIPALR
jgi:hypothetical protein